MEVLFVFVCYRSRSVWQHIVCQIVLNSYLPTLCGLFKRVIQMYYWSCCTLRSPASFSVLQYFRSSPTDSRIVHHQVILRPSYVRHSPPRATFSQQAPEIATHDYGISSPRRPRTCYRDTRGGCFALNGKLWKENLRRVGTTDMYAAFLGVRDF